MNTAIKPGQVWLDTKGERIQAHGASIFYENGIYYWYGEDKSHTNKKGKPWTWGIRCYSSKDLINWTDEGHLISPEPNDETSILHPNRRLDRPHIIKNEKTGKYICWVKYCDIFHMAVFVADSFFGPYSLINPNLLPYNREPGDFDLAVDRESGNAYLFVELDHKEVVVCKLNEDYTDVTDEYSVIYTGLHPPFSREGVTHFEHHGKHYVLTSGMSGYVPNPSEVVVSNQWMGPYTVLGDPHENDPSSASFNSQASGTIRVAGTDLTIIVADRWIPNYVMTKERYDSLVRAIANRFDKKYKPGFKDMINLFRSPIMTGADTSVANYVWLPVEWNGDIPVIRWYDEWKIEDFI